MRAITTLLAASLLLTGPALRAADPAKAEEFLRVAKLEDMLKQAMELAGNQMKSGIIQQISGGQSKPEDVADKDRIFSFVTSLFGWDTVKPMYVKIYSDAFTDEELDGIIAFYKSPAGQAMSAKTPLLMQKANEAMQARMATIGPDLQKLIAELSEKAAERRKAEKK